jgi:hypothetical protein
MQPAAVHAAASRLLMLSPHFRHLMVGVCFFMDCAWQRRSGDGFEARIIPSSAMQFACVPEWGLD